MYIIQCQGTLQYQSFITTDFKRAPTFYFIPQKKRLIGWLIERCKLFKTKEGRDVDKKDFISEGLYMTLTHSYNMNYLLLTIYIRIHILIRVQERVFLQLGNSQKLKNKI